MIWREKGAPGWNRQKQENEGKGIDQTPGASVGLSLQDNAANLEADMNATAGLWIDHRKAVIAIVSAKGQETIEIKSHVDKQPGRIAGVRSTAPYESQLVKADDRLERKLTAHLNQYYARVISCIRDTDAILICGPGEAKGELQKRLTRNKVGGHITVMETVGKLTDRQIAAKALKYFHEANSTPSHESVAGDRKPRRNTPARPI